MTLEIIGDAGDEWEIVNVTTQEIVFFNKILPEDAMKLGKVAEILDDVN